MSLDKPTVDAALNTSMIQSRITAVGFCLTILTFAMGFTLNLSGQGAERSVGSYQKNYVHIEVAVVLGVLYGLVALLCFLRAQERFPLGGTHETESDRNLSIFALGQLLLYLALAQALSASLTEVTYGVSQRSVALGIAVSGVGTLVWILLAFVFPVSFLRRLRTFGSAHHIPVSWLWIFWMAVTLVTFVVVAVAYTLNEAFSTSGEFLAKFGVNLLWQFVQPASWWSSFS